MTDASAFTGSLLAIDKTILGATVNNPAGDNLGTIDDLMVDSDSGRIVYAVMSFGGLFGLGKQYYPVPWELVRYDTEREVAVVDLDKARLENAPNYGLEHDWTRRYAADVDSHYGIKRPPPTTA